MKKISYLLSLVVLAGVFTMVGCGDDDDDSLTLEQQQLQFLEGTWSVGSSDDVSLDTNTGTTGDWSNFSINFQSNGSVVVNGESDDVEVFSVDSYTVSGTQVNSFTVIFDGTDEVIVTRGGSDNEMLMTFTITDDNPLGARTQGISGAWIFDLTKQ
ncbi:MAG: hypothetical protein AAGG59_04670 [Bacteroidota bacterium]